MIDVMILIGVFLGGAVAGFLALLRIGIAQEGRWLSEVPPTRIAVAARRFMCLHVQIMDADAADAVDGCR
jgi:hypothetical protein